MSENLKAMFHLNFGLNKILFRLTDPSSNIGKASDALPLG